MVSKFMKKLAGWVCGAAGHGKLAKPAHQMALERTLVFKGQSCPRLCVPQSNVVADITHNRLCGIP